MKTNAKGIIINIIVFIGIGLLIAGILALAGMSIYAWVMYGDKNITEIPYWAIVIMGK